MAWQDRDYNRENVQSRGGGIPPVRMSFPPITALALTLIAVNVLVFIVQAATASVAAASPIVAWGGLAFFEGAAWQQPWRWITYQYIHGDGYHIFFNCIACYFFLPPLERRWGWKKAFGFYTLGGIASGVTYGLMLLVFAKMSILIGASGSILACLGACALLFPEMQLILVLFVIPIRVAAALITILYILTVAGDRNLSDAAHLGGLAFGWFGPMTSPWFRRWAIKYEARQAAREFEQEQQEQGEIDRILAKVHEKGMHSLTSAEKRTLKRATERQRKRDERRGG
jgi:membrane associated rhomboid family serine protease